jgi:flagellar motility protein MotE (MotC chaperone)
VKRHAEAPGAPYSRPPPPIERGVPREPLLDLATPARSGEIDATPPAISTAALRDELASSARRRQEELATIARERTRLEKLLADVAAARASLKEETERLEARTRRAEASGPAPKAAPEKPAAHPARKPDEKPPAEAMAKALKGMKIDAAAALLAKLDQPLAVDLLRRMRPGDAGALLEKLKPEAAAQLVAALATDGGGKP